MSIAGDLPDTTVRRIVLAVLAAVICSWIFATGVFLDFEPIRIRMVREPMPVTDGEARLDIVDERANDLRPPFALIARLRNDTDQPLRFSIRVNTHTVCETRVAAFSARRVDCAVRDWDPQAGGQLIVESDSPRPWTLEDLELATHHGRSTGWLQAMVLPSGASDLVNRPSRAWAIVVGMTLAALLLVPTPRIASRTLRLSYAVGAVVASVPFAAVLVAPIVSPYRIVLSPWTFAGWLAIPLLPRVPLVWRVVHFFRTPWRAACGLAAAVFVVAVVYGARVVGGSDEYGYVSQADLWLRGNLIVDQPFVRGSPWPERMPWWFSPLGYRPHPSDAGAIVPVYSPGLPMMLALAKSIGGQDAVFVVVPLFGGLLVLATYALGRRLGSGIAPLVAAWLVATSPVVLAHSMATMSDVPVAAAWMGALCLLLGTSTASAAGAGALTGVAVLIRPNLAPLALVLGSLYLVRMRASGVRSLVHLAVFGVAAAPAAIIIAILNNRLYGSPLASGYGPLAELFMAERMLPNLRNYLGELVEVHTPVVLLGLAALAFPVRRLWPAVRERAVLLVIGAFVAAIWAIYCAWVVFDSWWYSRFLLASFPLIMLGVGACADALFRKDARWIRIVVVGGIVAVGLAQLRFASTHTVFEVGPGMRRYAVAAALTRRVTEPNSVVITLNHSGSVRYYGARVTVNFANMAEGGPMDDFLDWLQKNGVRTYATLEDWEVKEFAKRFPDAAHLAAFDRPPLAVFNNPGRLLVYDLAPGRRTPPEPVIVDGFNIGRRAVRPSQAPRLVMGQSRGQ